LASAISVLKRTFLTAAWVDRNSYVAPTFSSESLSHVKHVGTTKRSVVALQAIGEDVAQASLAKAAYHVRVLAYIFFLMVSSFL
jgi:hypothetical protein